MTTVATPRLISWLDRSYRLLLLCYPATFRRAYASEMAQTFRTACRETLMSEGYAALLRVSGWTLSDLVVTSCREHFQTFLSRCKRLLGNAVAGEDALAWTAPLRLQVAQETDIGCVRKVNEDTFITVLPENAMLRKQKGALFVVADGMGGHSRGERASHLAVDTVREIYYQSQDEEISATLVRAFQQANERIYAENQASLTATADKQKRDMGTTCIAAVLLEKTLVVANVGDSRAYVIDSGQLRQISRDHSVVAEMVRAGEITAEEARTHEKRNIIYRSLGTSASVDIDVFEEEVAGGNALLLCTDGLTNLVPEQEVLRIIEAYEPQASVQQLISSARQAGGSDNITAIVVRVDL